jgi:HlyD family secretion protein
VRRGDIAAVVSATGTLSPVNTVQVGSQVSGTIQHLRADFNDQVKQGQVVAQIDPAIFRAKLAEAEANVKSAEASVDKAWVSVLDAKRELDRQSNLFKKKLVAESVLDAARFAYDSARVEHQVKQAALAQTEAAREREQVNLAYTTIYAPIDGVVISRDVDVGQTVAASLQAPTLFTIANDLASMQVEADVDESFIGQVHAGQPVRFTVFAYPGRTFEGQVAQVRLNPKVEAGVVKYNSIIHVDNADLALKPGMTATVAIQVAEHKDVLQVPTSALRFVPDWPEDQLADLRKGLKPGQGMVWTPDGASLRPITVTTGISGERFVEVSGAGLQADMPVLVPEKRKSERKRRFGLSLF